MLQSPQAQLIDSTAARAPARGRGRSSSSSSSSPGAPGGRRHGAPLGHLLGVLLLALGSAAVGACGHSDEHAGHTGETSEAPFDQQFIDMMTPHHEGAVLMARTAQERAEHAELKVMADEIISAQNQEISQMKGWREQWYGSGETPPVDEMPMLPGMDHDSTMDMVQANEELKTADPFDKAFIDAMIPHHQMAIEAAQIAQQKAEHAEIKELAPEIIDAQQKEIDQMKAWRAAWYPEQ